MSELAGGSSGGAARSILRPLALVVLCAALAASGCGGGEEGPDTAPAGPRAGGEATVSLSAFPDFLDPALSYTQEAWNSLSTVYTPLLAFRRAEGVAGAEVVPGLAAELPTVSEGGRRYELTLREGLEYSDGTPVRASDFEHAIKRVLNLESGGSSFFLGIDGAAEYQEAGRQRGDIAGIEADDEARSISITLDEPDGTFPFVLALPFAAPVPGDMRFENLTRDPPPGVGPFSIADVRQDRGYELVRNDSFPEIDGIPGATLERITVDINGDLRRQTQDVIRNDVDWMIDPPAPDMLRLVRSRHGDRFEEFVTNSTYYFFMNHRTPPFDDERVRQAVNFGIDKRALSRLYGGLLDPSCNYLPPRMQGYEPIEPCPYGDPETPPQRDRARELIREAGAEGERVTVWGYDIEPARPVTEYLADVLNQMGLDARPRIVASSAYFQTVGNQETDAQIGLANWFQDFPHPANFMTQVNPANIQDTNNPNLGNIAAEPIREALATAARQPLDEAAATYAEVDRALVENAHLAPYGFRELTNFVSERVDFEDCTVTHPVYQLDLTQLCLR